MHEYPVIVFAALLILGYGLFSKLSERSVISAPMVFVTIGIILSFFVHEEWVEGIDANWVSPIAEITLILVLFTDASTLNRKILFRDRALPLRLLLIGLPLTMVFGILIAFSLFPGVDKWQLAMMAIILSPTDAALGLAVVTSKIVPLHIRQTINTESGLNDGIALPPLLICIAILGGQSSATAGFDYWGMFTIKQFVFGPFIGALVGWVGGKLVEVASNRGWMSPVFQSLSAIALAILSYAMAEVVHGNGFIAAFFAGLMLGTQTEFIRERMHSFGEAESQALILFVFLLMGLVLVPLSFPYWDWRALLYAILSLTIIRMLPVGISLIGSKLDRKTVGFIGWFGPRGIASVLYTLLVINEIGKAGNERIIAVIALTVLMSIFLHGITAIPLSKSFAGKEV